MPEIPSHAMHGARCEKHGAAWRHDQREKGKTMGYRDYGPGMCDACGHPVYYPQYQRPGFEGCQCPTPDLWTWERLDDEMDPPTPEPESPQVTPGTILRVQRGGFWKKRARNL